LKQQYVLLFLLPFFLYSNFVQKFKVRDKSQNRLQPNGTKCSKHTKKFLLLPLMSQSTPPQNVMCLPQNYNQQCGDEKKTKSQKMEKKIQPTTTTLMISDSVYPKAAPVAVATAETMQLSPPPPPPTTTEVEAAMQSVQFCHRQIRPLAGTQT
jgi:hypothetical protein